MSTKKKATMPVRSLSQFKRDQRKKDCKVCKLPEEIRVQIRDARGKEIRVATIVEWLTTECKAKISHDDLRAHNSGRHDDETT